MWNPTTLLAKNSDDDDDQCRYLVVVAGRGREGEEKSWESYYHIYI